MPEQQKLSLLMAILVNISAMFGVGIFINTIILAKRAGGLGFLSYFIIALLMMPLIISIGKLLVYYPTGGFYSYAAYSLSPFYGFISSWSYFIGKLGSAALLIDVFSRIIKTIIPALKIIPTFALYMTVIVFFTLLNMFNIKTNMSIIYTFVVMKFIPVIFAILSSLYVWQHWSLPSETLYWSKVPLTIPLVLYTFIGFEVACSISRTIKNPRKNTPKAIFYSFGLVVCITILYQLLFFLPLGTTLMSQDNYLEAFPSLISLVFPNQNIIARNIANLLHICTAAAALGGSYAMLFSNHWNLYTLAEYNHTFFSHLLTKMNRYHVPVICIIVEALVCIGYLVLTQGNQLLLQQISVFGCSIAYTLSIISLIRLQASNQSPFGEKIITFLAFGSCIIFLSTCINNLLIDGPFGLFVYVLIIIAGMIMYYFTQKTQINSLDTSSTQL